MSADASRPRRRSIRLRGYDYASSGAYFVTVCARQREPVFIGPTCAEIASRCLRRVTERFGSATMDMFVVMPNHVHLILLLGGVEGHPEAQDAPTLGRVVRAFKAGVALGMRRAGHRDFAWQRNYCERVIRAERELSALRQYIADNPVQWEVDRENPDRTGACPVDGWLHPCGRVEKGAERA